MNLHFIIAAIVEGLTEFIPVSSTAHIIIASKLMNVDLTTEYVKFFLLFIQFGALCAGVFLFAKKLLTNKKMLINVCVSFVPTAVIGFILYKLFKHLLEGNMPLIGSTLLVGGVIFIYLEKVFMKKRGGESDLANFGKTEISYTDAFVIGLAQAVAIVPGVSRSGATIVGGILRGIKKAVIIEYTFVLALPTIAAATLYDMYKSRAIFSTIHSYAELATGFIVSFIVAGVTLYLLKKYLPRISLTAFGWYRIALAVLVFIVIII